MLLLVVLVNLSLVVRVFARAWAVALAIEVGVAWFALCLEAVVLHESSNTVCLEVDREVVQEVLVLDELGVAVIKGPKVGCSFRRFLLVSWPIEAVLA